MQALLKTINEWRKNDKIRLVSGQLCLTFAVEPAFAKVSLEIYGQSYKKVTIATPPFKGDNGKES